jgi:hypothetical protein
MSNAFSICYDSDQLVIQQVVPVICVPFSA